MDKNTNTLNWFEIPAADIDRAKKFYETAFDVHMDEMNMGDFGRMVSFPMEGGNGKVGGALVQSPMHKPTAEGQKVYLNGNPDLQHVLDRVEAAGGKILQPKQQISPEIGYMGFFEDSEGNHLGLHSNG